MLCLCRVFKFQRLSFGSRQLCAKIVLTSPLQGSILLVASTEHLGASQAKFKGSERRLLEKGRSGLMGTSGEFPIGCSACHSDTFIEHMLCADDTGDLTLYLERPTGTITMPQILWLEWKVAQPTTAGMRGVAQGEGAWMESGESGHQDHPSL